ncbi:hypothetical protein KP78_29270 [Jeotgalibacillus soli]|uniref:Uncharacterized protein n=1 Tax=Jeotgalibacillus soli TaxID=889306 RepID=A0A0C2VN05_9BACL|nr:hypothetical protein KP78_29270 [Jeotgalibacillus soli]
MGGGLFWIIGKNERRHLQGFVSFLVINGVGLDAAVQEPQLMK